MYLVNISTPFALGTWFVFSIQKHMWMCALHPKNTCLHFFLFHSWDKVWVIHYLFFLFHSANIYYLFSSSSNRYLLQWTKYYTSQFMTNSKAQKDEEKKERTSVSLLHSSKFTRPVACANRAWRFILFWCWNQHEFSSPSLNVTGCSVPRWELEGCTEAKPLAQRVII